MAKRKQGFEVDANNNISNTSINRANKKNTLFEVSAKGKVTSHDTSKEKNKNGFFQSSKYFDNGYDFGYKTKHNSYFESDYAKIGYKMPSIKLDETEVSTGPNGKPRIYTKFYVGSMTYSKELGKYTEFTVYDNKGALRFDLKKSAQATVPSSNHTQEPQKPAPTPSAFASGSSFCSECNAHITSPKVAEY